jgi:hypothetical protein
MNKNKCELLNKWKKLNILMESKQGKKQSVEQVKYSQ